MEISAVVRLSVAAVVSATICPSERLLMTLGEKAATWSDERAATLAVVSALTSVAFLFSRGLDSVQGRARLQRQIQRQRQTQRQLQRQTQQQQQLQRQRQRRGGR